MQWHQRGHLQVCISLQTDNHASTPPLCFLQAGCPSCSPTNSVKALKAPITSQKQDIKLFPYLPQILNDFQNYFTDRLSGKFATNSCLDIHCTLTVSLHYLVKYLCSKSRHAQQVIEANCHLRFNHSKKLLKYLVKYSLVNSVTKVRSHRPYKKFHYRLYTKKKCHSKMPYMISSWSVTDGISLSFIKSKLVCSSLIFVENKLTLICLLT